MKGEKDTLDEHWAGKQSIRVIKQACLCYGVPKWT